MKTKKIVMAAMFAALACVATMVIKIPSPLKGYLNLGDCVVLLAGWLLSPVYGFLAAGIGSALADVFAGYAVYAPVTFVIKGTMAVVVFLAVKLVKKSTDNVFSCLSGAVAAELIMIGGYFLFESLMYGIEIALSNVPLNGLQGTAGLVTGLLLYRALRNIKKI